MQPPPSLHSNFFSSLKQVEKRLKLEHQPPPPPPPAAESQTQEGNISSTESLSTPLFLHIDQQPVANSSDQYSSEPPRAFLSDSQDFPSTRQDPPRSTPPDRNGVEIEAEDDEIDDIERLIGLLGLSNEEEDGDDGSECNSCHCEGGFYSKIVGMKGPKCGKEMKRVEGWIKHFREEKKEPLRLAHLLLGKSAFIISEGVEGGFGGLEFPSTVQEFLHNDPPS